MSCNICGGELRRFYLPPTTRRGAIVYRCMRCDLLQTLTATLLPSEYINNYEMHKDDPRISCGADWGNIRHGKEVRAEDNFAFIDYHGDIYDHILDIGSSRGALLRLLKERYKPTTICGIEPDARLHNPEHVQYLRKFEEVDAKQISIPIQDRSLVCISHTLEHIDDLHKFMIHLMKVINSRTHIFIEVPNTTIINNDDCWQEYFIDKHTYHFTAKTLENVFARYGLYVMASQRTPYNLTYLVTPHAFASMPTMEPMPAEPPLVIEFYTTNQKKLDEQFTKAAITLNALARKGQCEPNRQVVLWGANSILDRLVRNGLRIQDFTVVDDYIGQYDFSFYGTKIQMPGLMENPDMIIVLGRASAQQIRAKALQYTQSVLLIKDLLQ